MCLTEDTSSPLGLIKYLKDEMMRGKKDCQKEATNLFKKIYTAIEVHTDTPSVSKGLDALAVKVSYLEAKLSNITMERDNLLRTVINLRNEHGQFSSNFLPRVQTDPLLDLKEEHGQDDQEFESMVDGIVPPIEKDKKRQQTHKRKQRKPIRNMERSLDDSTNTVKEEVTGAREIDYVVSSREASQTKGLVQELIKEGFDDAGEKIDTQEFKCDQCTWSTSEEYRMKEHIKEVHDKKSYECAKCGYAASRKDKLVRHIKEVHEKLRIHQCKECVYRSSRKDRLDRHIRAVHVKITNDQRGEIKYQCKECPYAAARKDGLDRHISAVHEKSKNYKCEECEYAFSRKDKLDQHLVAVHKHNKGGNMG